MATKDYNKKQETKYIKKLSEIITELPDFCGEFFVYCKNHMSIRTCLTYSYNIRLYLRYFSCKKEKPLKSFDLNDLSSITDNEIEEWLSYLTSYEQNGKIVTNSRTGKKNKLTSIKTFYNFFFARKIISINPAALVENLRLVNNEITVLEPNEIVDFLNSVEYGSNLSKKQMHFHEKTKYRDIAIATTLLGTGIRISELVGLDINDIDFDNCSLRIERKGGKVELVYFGNEVEAALQNYLEFERNTLKISDYYEKTLFISLKNQRLSARAVEMMIKKYNISLKKITPHKLRSTYGTTLYRETGDIFLVANTLGHNDVNTTKKHYAKIGEDIKRNARNKVILRKDTTNNE